MSDEPADLSRPYVDAAAVVADQRGLDQVKRQALYRRVFGGRDGQAVLVDMMIAAGVGVPRQPQLPHDMRVHMDGQEWAVLSAAKLAGYEAADIATALLNSSLRGLNSHDRTEPRPGTGARLPGDDAEPF